MRKKLLLFVVAPLLVLAAAAVVLGALVSYEPAFYRAAAAPDPDQARTDAREFVSRASQLASDIHNESTWCVTFSEAQINGWLAADFRRKHSDRLPLGISDVRVALTQDRALVGYRAKLGPLHCVASVSVQVWLPEPNLLAVKLERVAAGALPVPLDYLMSKVTEAARRSRWPIEWKQHEGRPLALVRLPNDSDGDTVELCKLILVHQRIHLQGNCVPAGSTDHVALQPPTSPR